MDPENESPIDRNHGPQPLDELLARLGLDNHDLVASSTDQLTHKQVQKARKGRHVTKNIQMKILRAVQASLRSREDVSQPVLSDLFNYSP